MKVAILTLIAALALTACDQKTGSLRPRPVSPKPKLPPAPKSDECPSAEGKWTLEGGVIIEISRSEGFLTVQHPELSSPVIMDGVTRKIDQTSTGSSPEVTGTCSQQLVKISYRSAEVVISQSWVVDLEKDSIVISEVSAKGTKTITGSRRFN